eukprot:8938706-Pyramimonas_sp.AAC.1
MSHALDQNLRELESLSICCRRPTSAGRELRPDVGRKIPEPIAARNPSALDVSFGEMGTDPPNLKPLGPDPSK